MNPSTRAANEETSICIIAVLVACVVAANQITDNGIAGWVGSYVYWFIRILIQTALFVATLYSLEKYAHTKLSNLALYVLAMLVSLVPFALAITSFDLIIGLPELGIDNDSSPSAPRLMAFGKELIYLLDNQLALCTMLLLPRLRSAPQSPAGTTAVVAETQSTGVTADKRAFLDNLEPPLTGQIYWIEAQEHYVRITTSTESRMVLLRFTDAIREIPESEGMQVHRSHWVAFRQFKSLQKDGQNSKLRLYTDELVPVSRSYRQRVEQRFRQVEHSRDT